MPRDKQTIRDISRACRLILQFQQDTDKTAFLNNVEKQSAILYQFTILGEAVKRLSLDFRVQHSEIPWSSIAGMRDKLIHDYDGVNLERVWRTAEENIPVLLAMIEALPAQEE